MDWDGAGGFRDSEQSYYLTMHSDDVNDEEMEEDNMETDNFYGYDDNDYSPDAPPQSSSVTQTVRMTACFWYVSLC